MEVNNIIALVSILVTLTVALIGVFGNMYLANQNKKKELLIKEKEIEQEEIRFLLGNLKDFWEEQNRVLKRTLITASILTLNEDIQSEAFQEEYKNLWQLLFGELPMYDVENVKEALQALADKAYEKKNMDPSDKAAIKAKKKEMKPYLTNLAERIKETSMVLEYSQKLKNDIRIKW